MVDSDSSRVAGHHDTDTGAGFATCVERGEQVVCSGGLHSHEKPAARLRIAQDALPRVVGAPPLHVRAHRSDHVLRAARPDTLSGVVERLVEHGKCRHVQLRSNTAAQRHLTQMAEDPESGHVCRGVDSHLDHRLSRPPD